MEAITMLDLLDEVSTLWIVALAQLLPLSAAIWALLWFVKDVIAVRYPGWHSTPGGKLALRTAALVLGVLASLTLRGSGLVPWIDQPVLIVIAAGILVGLGAEVVYRWGGRTIEGLARRALGPK